MKKLLFTSLLLLLVATPAMGASSNKRQYLQRNGNVIYLNDSNYTFGDNTNPIPDGQYTNLTISGTFTVAAIIMTGDIDMDDNDINNLDQLVFTTSGSIETLSNGDLTLLPNGTGISIIGDAGSTSHTLNTNDDLFIAGKLEVDGETYLDGFTYNAAGLRMNNQVDSQWGTNADTLMRYSTAQTPDSLILGVGTSSRGFVIAEKVDVATDFAHGQETNPTVFVQSADETSVNQYISIEHNQTSAVIHSGEGNIQILPVAGSITQIGDAGSTSQSLAANDDLFVSGKLEIDDVFYADGGTFFASYTRQNDTVTSYYGGNDDSSIQYGYGNSPDSLMIGLGTESRGLIIHEQTDFGTDFGHIQQTNPTVFIQSANQSATEWMSLAHNQTNGVIDVGTGNIVLNDDVTISSNIVYTPSSVTTLAAGDTLTSTNTIEYVDGNGGAVTLTSTPNIANGTVGQCITIFGDDGTNTVTFQDEDNLGSSGLALAGDVNAALGVGDNLQLCYTTLNSVTLWREISRQLTIDD